MDKLERKHKHEYSIDAYLSNDSIAQTTTTDEQLLHYH